MQKRLWIVALSLLTTPVTKSWAATRQFPSILQGSHANSNLALKNAVPREQSSACTTESDGVKVCTSVTPPKASDNFLVDALDKISFDNYHLLWSPSFLKKTITSVATLFVLRFTHTWTDGFAGWFSWATTASPFMANVANNIVLPLMASACCMLQLLINILAGGCAGFNTVLGPIRPYSLGLLLYLTATTTPHGNHKLLTHSLRWSVALMPEGLHFWNALVRRRRVAASLDQHQPRLAATTAAAAAPISATIHLNIPSMGCVACISNIDSALQVRKENARVVEAASALYPFGRKGGEATIRVEALTERHVDEIVNDLIEAVEKAGFEGASVSSVRKFKNSK